MGNNNSSSNDEKQAGSSSMDWEVSEYLKAATAKFVQRYHFLAKNSKKRQRSLGEFVLYQCLGSGAFAHVYLARDNSGPKEVDQGKFVAIKVLDKKKVVADHQEEHVMSEKRLLSAVEFPFIVRLLDCFQDPRRLCLLLEFMPGGELFSYLRKEAYFNEETARFYAAQVLLALEYLHHLNIAYRDLKPENVLMSASGYIKIADFGFAKLVPNRTYTLCGTPEYLAPEIIASKGYSRAVDWWAFGVLLYELCAGYSPFFSERSRRIYQKILANQYLLPRHFSRELRSLLRRLLEPDTSKRYGCLRNRVDDLRQHRFFQGRIDWLTLFSQQLLVPGNFERYREQRRFRVGDVTRLPAVTSNAPHGDDFQEDQQEDIYASVFSGF